MLNDSGLMFNKKRHMLCMAHVLNLALQGGFKDLSNLSLTLVCLESEDDEECEEHGVEVISQREFGVIINGLQKLAFLANNTLQKLF